MSKISQYPVVQAAADDLVIVTAPNASPSNATKNVTVGSIAQFAAQIQLGYDVYTANLKQKTTDDPTADELNNTTGATMTYKRNGVGDYEVTASATIFDPIEKVQVWLNYGNPGSDGLPPKVEVTATDTIIIKTQDETGVLEDDLLTVAPFEIRIYK